MGLRPARTCREVKGQPWARISKKKPRKSYVKGAPNVKVRQFNMGSDQYFDLEIDLVPDKPIQLRDNSLEAARQAINKVMEKALIDQFFLQVLKYPHLVLREHTNLGVAGADRISKGMKLAFGRPKGRMARIGAGEAVFRARVLKAALPVAKTAFKRGQLKLSGAFTLIIKDISNEQWNIDKKARGVVSFRKKVVEEAKVEAAPAAEGAAGEAAKPLEGKEGEKADAKPAAPAKGDAKPKAEKK
ncbi:50S ribosomal protein L16 [Candidatus Micrarchaeota archaeon]|nr:50S ribosomal protein L16 [Candidatus Micrarchaeota archaeon]